MTMTVLLILHGLAGVALLGAVTHQCVGLFRRHRATVDSFTERYRAVQPRGFSTAIVFLVLVSIALGAIIYPTYRVDVRIPFEEMSLGWAIGLFEMKEHAGGIALGLLPLYAVLWRGEFTDTHRLDRTAITLVLALIVWWDFIVGHVLNNIRGFG